MRFFKNIGFGIFMEFNGCMEYIAYLLGCLFGYAVVAGLIYLFYLWCVANGY